MSKKSTKKDNQKMNPYAIDRFATFNPKLKIVVLKFWVVGATFYMTVFGLPQRFDFLDRMVVFTLVLIIALEYVAYTIIHWMNNDQFDSLRYLPHEINRKSVFSLLGTGLYVIIIVTLVHFFIDTWVFYRIPTIGDIMSETSIDPFTFGLVFLLFDFIWMKIRNTIKLIKAN